MLGLGEMRKGKDNKKEIPKIKLKKTKNPVVSKHINRKEPDLWKEISSKFQPIIKTYTEYKKKRKIEKLKKEERRLKEEEKQSLQEEEEQRLMEQEERKLKKEKRLKAQEEKKQKEEEERRLKAATIKEDQQARQRQAQIYKERMAKAERARLVQLEEATKLKEKRLKEKKAYDEYIEKRKIEKQKEEERKLKQKEEEERRLKESQEQEEIIQPEEERGFDEQKKKRLNGKVKWFSDAKGYGFIEREGEEQDIFVHFSAVRNSGLKYLKEGEQLMFEIENTDKGPSAINLQKIS